MSDYDDPDPIDEIPVYACQRCDEKLVSAIEGLSEAPPGTRMSVRWTCAGCGGIEIERRGACEPAPQTWPGAFAIACFWLALSAALCCALVTRTVTP